MREKTTYRKCTICGESKRTTNNEDPYIGEECLRTDGRDLLLSKSNPKRGMWILIIVIVIAFLLGKFVF